MPNRSHFELIRRRRNSYGFDINDSDSPQLMGEVELLGRRSTAPHKSDFWVRNWVCDEGEHMIELILGQPFSPKIGRVKVSIKWPALLNYVTSLKLLGFGPIISNEMERQDGKDFHVLKLLIKHHQFRTAKRRAD